MCRCTGETNLFSTTTSGRTCILTTGKDKGKMAGIPIDDLFGGKSREAAAVYVVPGGENLKEYKENIHRLIEQGFRCFKINGADRFFSDS